MRDNKEKLHIRLNLREISIGVNINPEDEANCRKAEKLINETINNYSKIYDGQRDPKEILYMAMLEIALKCVSETQRNDVAPLNDILSRLTSEIEDALA